MARRFHGGDGVVSDDDSIDGVDINGLRWGWGGLFGKDGAVFWVFPIN